MKYADRERACGYSAVAITPSKNGVSRHILFDTLMFKTNFNHTVLNFVVIFENDSKPKIMPQIITKILITKYFMYSGRQNDTVTPLMGFFVTTKPFRIIVLCAE